MRRDCRQNHCTPPKVERSSYYKPVADLGVVTLVADLGVATLMTAARIYAQKCPKTLCNDFARIFLQHGLSAMILPAVTSHANFPADAQARHAQPHSSSQLQGDNPQICNCFVVRRSLHFWGLGLRPFCGWFCTSDRFRMRVWTLLRIDLSTSHQGGNPQICNWFVVRRSLHFWGLGLGFRL